eukprot:s426_g7.t1
MWGVSNKEARLRLERLHDAYHDAVMPGAGWSETSVGFDTRIAVTAGTGNCLRATRMLVPEFNRASRANKVGKLLEAATRPQLDPFGVGAHLSAAQCAVEQGYRAGQSGDPGDVAGQMEQFLHALNLLGCAAPASSFR